MGSMRIPVAHPNVPLLKYAIREIVDVMQKLHEIDPTYHFVRENIGDPIAKGWPVPMFLKEILPERGYRFWLLSFARNSGSPEMDRAICKTFLSILNTRV